MINTMPLLLLLLKKNSGLDSPLKINDGKKKTFKSFMRSEVCIVMLYSYSIKSVLLVQWMIAALASEALSLVTYTLLYCAGN